MGLNITVRNAQGVETPHTIESDGDPQHVVNDNREIDTQYEAETALAYMSQGDTVSAGGGAPKTRDEIAAIRDRNTQTPRPNGTVAGEGASHGVLLEGQGLGGIGDQGHSGGNVRLSYRSGLSLHMGDWRVKIHPSVGLDVGHHEAAAAAPNGEPIKSEFTRVGIIAGADFSLAGPFLDHRLFASLGVRLGAGGFVTPESTSVNLPQTCTPDEFGRGECEPDAGPRTGNAGTTGLLNYDLGAARGTSGGYFYAAGTFSIGGEIVRAPWGNMTFAPYVEAGGLFLMPGDGHAFSFPVVGGGLNFGVNYGGNAVEGSPTSQTIENAATIEDAPVNFDQVLPSNQDWDATSLVNASVPANAQVRAVAFGTLGGQPHNLMGPPYVVTASEMTPGPHVLGIGYSLPGSDQVHTRIINFNAAEPRVLPPDGGGFIGIDHTEEIFRKRTQN